MSARESATPEDRAPEYLTADEVGHLLRISKKTVYRLAAQDATLPCLRLGGSVRFPRDRFLTWLRSREQGAGRVRLVAKAGP